MKKKLLLMTVLLVIGALFLKESAYGTEILVPAGGITNSGAQGQITYTMQDGTVLQTSGESNDFSLTITRPGMQPVSIALPDEIMEVNSINSAIGEQAVVIGDYGGGLSVIVLVNVQQYRIADTF